MTPAGQPDVRPVDLPGHPIETTAMTDTSAATTVGAAHELPAARPVIRTVRGLSDRAIAWWFILPSVFLLLAINIFPLLWTSGSASPTTAPTSPAARSSGSACATTSAS